jgi:hypothetical protein
MHKLVPAGRCGIGLGLDFCHPKRQIVAISQLYQPGFEKGWAWKRSSSSTTWRSVQKVQGARGVSHLALLVACVAPRSVNFGGGGVDVLEPNPGASTC